MQSKPFIDFKCVESSCVYSLATMSCELETWSELSDGRLGSVIHSSYQPQPRKRSTEQVGGLLTDH